MSVDKTSGINQNLIGKILTNQNLVKSGDVKKTSSSVSNDAQTLAGGDKVEISSEARELHKALSSLKDEVKQMPDTRNDKIELAKARIDAGFYEKDAVIKEVARSIKDSGLL
ncbi:MAG: flagellar biosynthesis anti-sigma factor FlgM [Candidatus Scalindua sp.]|nr:flagellar biosynthesis anti-sigma factor FlgM [Candidatus Scalindua sp.]